MRVLNAAQSSLSYLGVLAGLEHTSDDIADPLLAAFVRRMLMEESLPTLAAGARRFRRALCRAKPRPSAQHGDPPPQPPDRHRRLAKNRAAPARSHRGAAAARRKRCSAVGRGRRLDGLSHPGVGQVWQKLDGCRSLCRPYRRYCRSGRQRHRRRWPRKSWRSTRSSAASLQPAPCFARPIVDGLDGLLSDEPLAYVRRICDGPEPTRLKRAAANGIVGKGEENDAARNFDRAVCGHAAGRRRRLGELRRLRGAGDRVLAEVSRPEPPLCRHQPHRCREYFGVARPRRSSRR